MAAQAVMVLGVIVAVALVAVVISIAIGRQVGGGVAGTGGAQRFPMSEEPGHQSTTGSDVGVGTVEGKV